MTFTFADAVRGLRDGSVTADEAAERLIAEFTDAELLWLLDGDLPVWRVARLPAMMRAGPITGGALPRLGIPGIRFSDGPRGVVMGRSTAFPVTMARAATWDPDLEFEVGLAIGREARAQGANYSGAVCVNLLRHPGWGRAQECYGEDPVLTGTMGAALTRGLRRNVMACVKHFALNSIENARFRVDVVVSERALHEAWLPHFKTVVRAGADSVMTAYNRVNGVHADENRVLLTDILRDEWGFEGFVTSDWVWGTHDPVASLEAGLDIEMPLRMHRSRALPAAIEENRAIILRSARRILTTILRYEVRRDPVEPGPAVVASAEHRALAHRAAVRGMVLLRNEQSALPLPASVRRLALAGRLADEPNLGDHGSSRVHPPDTCTIRQGLRDALPGVSLVGPSEPADAAVVVVGMSHNDEGERIMNEDLGFLGFPLNTRPGRWLVGKLMKVLTQFGRGGDRTRLTLSPRDEELIATVAAAHPRTIVVLIGGGAILMEAWRTEVPAILIAWYPGMAGGRAVADVLTGAAEPGGRLPFAIPADAGHLPFFDPSADRIEYDQWWGQRKLDRDGHPAAYPFGFGLGYTTFTMSLVSMRGAAATVEVANTGDRAGATVVQVYALHPVPQLVGFRRVALDAGAATTVDVDLDLTPTTTRDPATRTWHRRPGPQQFVAAPHSPPLSG